MQPLRFPVKPEKFSHNRVLLKIHQDRVFGRTSHQVALTAGAWLISGGLGIEAGSTSGLTNGSYLQGLIVPTSASQTGGVLSYNYSILYIPPHSQHLLIIHS